MSNILYKPFTSFRIALSGKLFWIISSVLLFIAYITYVGRLPLDIETDEPRRALVSLEMMLSQDYVTPTLNGEIYLNKPPVYNWINILFFRVGGNLSMFTFRLPVLVSLACMGLLVYHFTKKYTNSIIAFFTAFAFCTNGRILIYDSFQGLIDTTFALIVYLNFMAIYWYGEKKDYDKMFLVSYLITSIGFLTKGVPILVFQGITLLVLLGIQKQWKRLFRRGIS